MCTSYSLNKILIIIFFLFCNACKEHDCCSGLWGTYSIISDKNIVVHGIELDNIEIDISNTSGIGKWELIENNLVFIDNLFGGLFYYDLNFDFQFILLGKGRGPNQIPGRIAGHAIYHDKIFILSPSYDFYEVNFDGEIINKGFLNFETDEVPFSKIENEPKSEYKAIYEVEYAGLSIDYLNKDEVIISISSSHPLFNPYTSKNYYKEARTLALLNLKDNTIKDIFGGYSPIYLEYDHIPYMSYLHLNKIDDNKFLLGFEADSLIYFFEGTNEINYAFGYNGRGMNLKYPTVNDYSREDEFFEEYRPKYGHFAYLKYVSSENLTFRGYQKDDFQLTDGLQIYKEGVLIGDIDVPKGFKIIGYNQPYYYAEISNPVNENFTTGVDSITLYRFKL
ncbi:MAG TPA: hypothetical protein PKC24_01980 [Cyclobacteriaceae bacterium]|nr:hypothetical protein [Cyclobacteriaceae bacterium]